MLPSAFTDDPERLARFEREAKLLASLNHPNIAGIHGLEESEGVRALALELVEGITLADRIAQGPIPVDEALSIARQIAEALEAAHSRGIIHRDLKPANIKLREDGTVKVLDFGLAKALSGDGSIGPLEDSPTITAAATVKGVLLGTAAYMSPEQARGKRLDKRTDIWAFGAVLYEMLTGERAFSGDDVTSVLAAVIQSEPDWGELPDALSPTMATYLRRALYKDPGQRVHDIADVRLAMEGAFDSAVSLGDDRPSASKQVLLWQRPVAFAGMALVAAIITWSTTLSLARPDSGMVTRFPIVLGDDHVFTGSGRPTIAITPQGDRVVFTGNDDLWTRTMDQAEPVVVPGTEGTNARIPFFSPDGESLAFYGRLDGDQQRQFLRLPAGGGVPIVIGPAENPGSASWAADGTIFFSELGGIWRVPATGGTPRLIIPVEEGAEAHGPQLLPDGDLLLFTFRPSDVASWNDAQVVVESLSSGDRTVLVNGGRAARYLSTGHLVYVVDGSIRAQALDLRRLDLGGVPVAMVEDVETTQGAQRIDGAQFAVSTTGTLVYVPDNRDERLVWVDHRGNEEFLDVPGGRYYSPRVSSDGTFVAVEVAGAHTNGIWVGDLARGTLSRLTSETMAYGKPLWTPDGQQVVFRRGGTQLFYRRSADGTGEAETLPLTDQPVGWTPNGAFLFETASPDGLRGIGVLPPEGEPRLLFETQTRELVPALSPDGQWLAYVSEETGRPEVYIQRFPDLGERWAVSTNGGLDPAWSPDGKSLYYLATGGGEAPEEMVVVRIDSGPSLSVGVPEVLFKHTYLRRQLVGRQYDVAPDGDRFLMVSRPADGSGRPQVNVVLNWFQDLTERVPVP